MKDTTIISQNLYNYTSKNPFVPSEYMKLYEADYYAFQEYPRIGRGFYSTIVDKNGNNVSNNIIEAQKIWNKYFPWSEFRSGYWSETSIKCGRKKIIIINVHLSTSYTDKLRLVLLQRLRQLKGKRVILVGDFNAAFKKQADLINAESHEFLSCILNENYIELKDEAERKGVPHYTYAMFDRDKCTWLKKKLDHVFISDSLSTDEGLSVEIEYLDEVNINCKEISKSNTSKEISDHTGIKIHISKKKLSSTNF